MVSGDKIDKITTIRKFKKIMIDLFRGYPIWKYYGIFEYHYGKEILEILKKDELIEVTFNISENRNEYRLSGKGVNFAVSMINLEHSERMLKYTKTIKTLTTIIVGVGCLTLIATLFNIPFIQELILHGIGL